MVAIYGLIAGLIFVWLYKKFWKVLFDTETRPEMIDFFRFAGNSVFLICPKWLLSVCLLLICFNFTTIPFYVVSRDKLSETLLLLSGEIALAVVVLIVSITTKGYLNSKK